MGTVFGFTASKDDELRETAWLDGLRGVAAFLVMVYHYHLDMFKFNTEAPYGAPNTQPWELWRLPYLRIIWCSGHTQVGIFFVLSGFVLSWSSLSSIREGRPEKFVQSLGSASFRRWMRLFLPCFLIGLLSLLQFYFALVELPITRRSSFSAQLLDYLWECERFSNPFHLERTNWEVLHKYNHTMWTMPVEWAGSLVVFMVLLMVSRIQSYTRRTIILAMVPIYSCLSAKWNYWLFTTGILLADYVKQAGGFKQLSDHMSRRSRLFWIFVLLVGGWLGGIPGKREWYERPGYEWTDNWIPTNWQDIEGGQRYFWCWSGIMIIWGLAHFTTLRRFFERPFCRYLGKISFMLYLTHRMIGTILGGPIRKQILNVLGTHYRAPDQPEIELVEINGFFWNIVAYLLAWACMLPLALALANWSTILVDEPCVKFTKWVDDKFVNGFVLEHERRAT
ncbi:uncharacterized protein LY89DRAFT_693563 [Mollisia scopiformis]|uniref:Acyltransferase 3 domain-containing protein n=1 Tax=Mollisia scopiformis TaxID=149040 RepID=A0A194XUS9_MOLSC|nr:uncharacterized protein LY89DRAFT_693563 [Mollisia scopiformis]KUJ23462.1 hypothetical protein LY89DRAFT_693563 [Mollisia scopiformis]